ncbi:glycosyltransferase family 4 protein [Myxococcus stipitatus]|uniref:glycosyltransferase family 4 protein n=1 Tax=Myxococcus stipitatus TaxID=83455 RepID=UPI0030D588E7
MTRLTLVAVSTGWSSSKGGLSTFNRQLSLGAAKLGHTVVCVVDEYDEHELKSARQAGVELVLAREARAKSRFPADSVVVGHGRITGPLAREIAAKAGCRRVHFLHMSPEAIEPYKRSASEAMTTANERLQAEIELALDADLVAAVGPRLKRDLATALHDQVEQVVSFLPGLPSEFGSWPQSSGPPSGTQCLLLGRAEDLELKGVDIAVRAMSLVDHDLLGEKPWLVIRGLPIEHAEQVKQRIHQLIEPGSLTYRFRPFTSNEQDVAKDILQSSLLLMPSREEGFGLTGLEAMAAGVPALITSRSGLGDFLQQEGHHRNVVCPVTGDLTKDAESWRKRIEIALFDRTAAFNRARELREKLTERLSWRRSIEGLLGELDKVRRRPAHIPSPPPNPPEALRAGLHLYREMDESEAQHTEQMLLALSGNVPPSQQTSPASSAASEDMYAAVLRRLANAHKTDVDAATKVELAIAALKSKYARMGFEPREWLKRTQPYHWPYSTGESIPQAEHLRSMLDYAEMIHRDFASIPAEALAFARAHGFRPHSSVTDGNAIGTVRRRQDLLEFGSHIVNYFMENLSRLFEAAALFVELDIDDLGRGYLTDGYIHTKPLRTTESIVAVPAQDEGQPSVLLFAVPRSGEATRVARLRARKQSFSQVVLHGVPPQLKVAAKSGRYLYRWSEVASTPEEEWTTSPGEKTTCWTVLTRGPEPELHLESSNGTSELILGPRQAPPWRGHTGEPDVAWRAQDGSRHRAYLKNGCLTVVREFEKEPLSAPLDFAVSVFPRYQGILKPENHLFGIKVPRTMTWGRIRGRDCLVVLCHLDPGAVAFFFIDPFTLESLQAPVVTPFFPEEFGLADCGERSFLFATMMPRSDAKAALAVWDVTEGRKDESAPLLGTHAEGFAGWSLSFTTQAGQLDVYFTARPLELNTEKGALWRWSWPSQQAERLADIPYWMTSIAAWRRA